MKSIVFTAIVCCSCFPIAISQRGGAPSAGEGQAAFSVATIKPSRPDASGWGMNFTSNGFSARNTPLRKIIQEAYDVYDEERLSSGPDRMEAEKFDIEAKFDEASGVDFKSISLSQRRSMLQALLRDRFKLSIHHEDKELPVYALVIARNGPKLQRTATEVNSFNGIKGYDASITHSSRGFMEVKSFAMQDLAQILHHSAGRIVVDKTGLAGRYDFSLRWNQAPNPAPAMGNSENTPPPDSSGPSIFTAVQEQLGLELKPLKYPIDMIVVDHVELPSEN